MLFKYLLFIGSLFSPTKKTTQNIKLELANIIFKIFIGVILVVLIIFSLIQLGIIFQEFLSQFENQMFLKLICFGSIVIFCHLVLFFLFKSNSRKTSLSIGDDGLDLRQVLLSFTKGVIKGMSTQK